MTNLMVTASFVFSSFVLIDELIVNSPTPPEKLIGLPSGNAFTLMVSLGVTIVFLYFHIVTSTIKESIKRIV